MLRDESGDTRPRRSALSGSRRLFKLAGLLLASAMSLSANAMVIGNSVSDFSATQSQDGWFYGLFDQGPDTTLAYTTGAFTPFDTFAGAGWGASDGLVGAQNNAFLGLDADGGHPTGLGPDTQDSIIWAVRRYVTPFAGPLFVDFDLHKRNVANSQGGGITGRIFVNGNEVFSRMIGNFDGVGVQMRLIVDAVAGAIIDFAIDPTGVSPGPPTTGDGDFAARADGTVFSAVISTAVPEPGSIVLLGFGGLLALGWGRRRAG